MATPSSPSQRDYPSWLLAALVTLFLRLFYSALAALLAPHLTLAAHLVQSNHPPANLLPGSPALLPAWLGVWMRFDTIWYLHIAQHGYDRPDSVVFFPLYPWLVRLVSLVTGQSLVAALLVSTLAAFFLFWGFQRLLLLDLPRDTVTRALALYAVWPTAFVFFSGYAESLVVALIVWSMYFARRGWWWWSGLAGGFAALAKAVGVLVIVPQAVLAWRERKWRAAPIALTLLGSAAFALWLKASGFPLPTEAYSGYWKTYPAWPWVTLSNTLRAVPTGEYPMLLAQLVFLALTTALAFHRRFRPEYTLYLAAALCLLLTKNAVPAQQQFARYILILFIAPVNLALLCGPGGRFRVVLLGCFVLNFAFLHGFLEWALVV